MIGWIFGIEFCKSLSLHTFLRIIPVNGVCQNVRVVSDVNPPIQCHCVFIRLGDDHNESYSGFCPHHASLSHMPELEIKSVALPIGHWDWVKEVQSVWTRK